VQINIEQLTFISGLVFIWLVSPDSDFLIVVKKSLSISYKKAIFVALGITLTTLFHIVYISIGLELISSNVKTIKYFGVIYLIDIGIKGLLAKKNRCIFISN
jgi:threonine/homoserine/homoserine lactone efflux protein